MVYILLQVAFVFVLLVYENLGLEKLNSDMRICIARQMGPLCVMFYLCRHLRKTCLVEDQIVSSKISCFHPFVIIFMVGTAQGATKMFAVDFHERQISQVLIKAAHNAQCLIWAYDI